jgi:hypothetical protein
VSQTSRSFEAIGEAFDVESEVYCQRRSGNIWRMRASAASLGLACEQAATLGMITALRSSAAALGLARLRAPVLDDLLSTVLRSWVGFPVALP